MAPAQHNQRNSAAGSADAPADLARVFSEQQVAERLRSASPTAYAAAERYWRAAFQAGTLSPRMTELVLVALYATSTSLYAEGVRRHVARALAAGATEQDVLDVVTTIVGVSNHALYSAVPVLMRELKAAGHSDAFPLARETQAIKEEFVRARGFWNEQRDAIARAMPAYFAALTNISTEPWKNGSLTEKERQLICIAIDCTVTHMYEPGLVIHIRHALQKGASAEEILAVYHLAALIGLESYILGGEALFGPDRCTTSANAV